MHAAAASNLCLIHSSSACFLCLLQRFWFVAPEDSIKELFSDPAFVKALLEAKEVKIGSFADSDEFKRLNAAVGGVLSSKEHGIIELGFDFAQPYNFLQHSTGFLFMR
jgi:hypothetical protein